MAALRRDRERALPAAAARDLGQRIERRRGRAEARQKLIERDRPDILAADEAQPVETFGRTQGARGAVHRGRTMRNLGTPRQPGAIFRLRPLAKADPALLAAQEAERVVAMAQKHEKRDRERHRADRAGAGHEPGIDRREHRRDDRGE